MQLSKSCISVQTAREFLTGCFAPGEFVALLLRHDNPGGVIQRVVPLERAVASRYLGWLAYQNSNGYNIYVAANPLLSGARKRTKECVAAVRHLYLDIDTDGEARLDAIKAADRVPKPNAIISTSPHKYQILWRVAGFDFEHQESILKQLVLAFGGDPACTDCNRVLRVPGFLNLKYDPPHHVTVDYLDGNTSGPRDFRLEMVVKEAMPFAQDLLRRGSAIKRSNSEFDWAWVLRQLANGTDPLKLTVELAKRRCDKSSPFYYAQRTVDLASARLWLAEGVRFDDVVTMLEERRRFEISDSIRAARSHEVALTAQRMISRRKSA
jgi:hypothetical protein